MAHDTPPYRVLSREEDKPRRKLLVYAIDDDEVDILRLKRMFKQISEWQVDFLGFESTESALATIGARPPDLIFLDYYLHGDLGIGILRGLREAGISCPIIAMTGLDDARIATDLMRGGANDYIIKSDLNPIVLRIAIESVLSKASAEMQRNLLQGQFLEAQKLEAVGTFAASIGDEYQFLVNALLGQIQLAAQADPQSVPERLEAAEQTCRELLMRTQRLRSLRAAQSFYLKTLDLCDIATRAYMLLAYTLPRAVHLEMRIPKTPLFIRATETGIQQILLHLCANAATAMKSGGSLMVEVGLAPPSAGAGETAGTQVFLDVADSGSALAPELRRQLLEPFLRPMYSDVPESDALGLPLVRSYVEQFQGTLRVEGNQNNGTTFRLLFPLEEPAGEL